MKIDFSSNNNKRRPESLRLLGPRARSPTPPVDVFQNGNPTWPQMPFFFLHFLSPLHARFFSSTSSPTPEFTRWWCGEEIERRVVGRASREANRRGWNGKDITGRLRAQSKIENRMALSLTQHQRSYVGKRDDVCMGVCACYVHPNDTRQLDRDIRWLRDEESKDFSRNNKKHKKLSSESPSRK